MAIIECLTDNPNRTFGDVRVCFTKTNSKIGTQGSVSHMFDHLSIFVFPGDDEEAILDALMEADVDVTDIECDDGKISVFAPDDQYGKTRQAIVAAVPDVDFDVDEIQFLPQAETKLTDEEDIAMFEKFLDMLNELDDVQNVYHNVEV